MSKKNDHLYPDHTTENWTGITEEALKEGGFIRAVDVTGETEDFWYHPKCDYIRVDKKADIWFIYFGQAGINRKGEEDVKWTLLRQVKYMYQIDNMFHGFTDRWLGYI